MDDTFANKADYSFYCVKRFLKIIYMKPLKISWARIESHDCLQAVIKTCCNIQSSKICLVKGKLPINYSHETGELFLAICPFVQYLIKDVIMKFHQYGDNILYSIHRSLVDYLPKGEKRKMSHQIFLINFLRFCTRTLLS